jgi:hypothetical protein
MPSFFSSRKAQGLSLNVIIIAVIAIVVLVVLIIIFTGKTRLFSQATTNCESKGGHCKPKCDPDTEVKQFGTDCASRENSPGSECCILMV